jgi:hypothetical protein
MLPEHLRSAILATAIWAIFAVAIVFSTPPAPGERGLSAAHADDRTAALAGARLAQGDRER